MAFVVVSMRRSFFLVYEVLIISCALSPPLLVSFILPVLVIQSSLLDDEMVRTLAVGLASNRGLTTLGTGAVFFFFFFFFCLLNLWSGLWHHGVLCSSLSTV